jgi:hypothetical protein
LRHDQDGNLSEFEIIAISMQGFYFLAFVIPSMLLLIKKWEHLDKYSRMMTILYQASMSIKLTFYIGETYIGEITKPLDKETTQVIMKSVTRAIIFLINSLFLLSLHVFVQKLVSRYLHYKAEDLDQLNLNKKKEKIFIYWTGGISVAFTVVLTVSLYFIWDDIYCTDWDLGEALPIAMLGL